MPGSEDDGEIPPLMDFIETEIVIDSLKTKGSLLFRELKSPSLLIFDDKIEFFIIKYRPAEGWAIRVTKLECS